MTDDGDHTHLIGELLDEVKPRKIVRLVITAAYAAGYEKHSDGITLMPELEFASFKMKHPVGVGHDFLLYLGRTNPYLPRILNTDREILLWDDNWFHDGLEDFGHPYRADIWWLGLRFGSWHAWNQHRKANHPFSDVGACSA